MFNCRTLIFSFTLIEIVPQRDLRWWTRRQVLPFIQFLSIFQSFSSHNAICWKCRLKNNCVRSCLIELQSFFDDSKINIDPKYRILMPFPGVLQVSCMTRYRVVNILWIFAISAARTNRQEEHRLPSAQFLTTKYQPTADNRTKTEIASHMVNKEIFQVQSTRYPVT